MKKCQTIEIRTFLKFIEVPIKPIIVNEIAEILDKPWPCIKTKTKNQGSTSSSLLIYKHQKKRENMLSEIDLRLELA